MAINRNHEIDISKLTRDTRSSSVRFKEWFFKPLIYRNFLILLIILMLWMPAFFILYTIFLLINNMAFMDTKFSMPLRMPKDIGGIDRTDFYNEFVEEGFFKKTTRVIRKYLKADGILYLGYLRNNSSFPDDKEGLELWLSNSDARTHMFIPGTTGSGKSETLMGLCYNALAWGSGFCYGDGKADNNLSFCLYSLTRRMGREDDFLLLNYLTGGMDPFEKIVAQEKNIFDQVIKMAQSNSLNPFSDGSADFLLQLMASLLPAATGDAKQWQEKALNMIDALLRTLCYKRAKGELDISIKVIRHYLSLQNLTELYIEGLEGKIPELAFLPIKAYFETGLPGFNPELVHDSTKWDPEVFNQHGYLTGQFSRTLGMMMDTYGFIFEDKYPEIDLLDVLLNNRILCVMIPSMEKSAAEAAALGKLYVSSIRLMMAQNLGYELEGKKANVLDAKATNSPQPYIIVSDELAYYFAAGIAVQFAQARSLGFMMIAAVQDIQGLKRGEAGEESASMIANTKVKWVLALEDPDDTYELIKKAGGEAYYSMMSGYDGTTGTFSNGYKEQINATVERKTRIDLTELKKLNAGEGLVIFKDSVVPSASFYISDGDKKTSNLSTHINRFLQIERPKLQKLKTHASEISKRNSSAEDFIINQNKIKQKPFYKEIDDPILKELTICSKNLDAHLKNRDIKISAEERGIVLFETARKALHKLEKQGITSPFHQAVIYEDSDWLDDDLDADFSEDMFDNLG